VSPREHVFMLQNCASECVSNRTYRTLQETCDEGAPCSSDQGSEALIGGLHIQALPTNRQQIRTCCCTCSCHKILCCNRQEVLAKTGLRAPACRSTVSRKRCPDDWNYFFHHKIQGYYNRTWNAKGTPQLSRQPKDQGNWHSRPLPPVSRAPRPRGKNQSGWHAAGGRPR